MQDKRESQETDTYSKAADFEEIDFSAQARDDVQTGKIQCEEWENMQATREGRKCRQFRKVLGNGGGRDCLQGTRGKPGRKKS
eukprot:752040-Hanusia_phi.AAC.2